MCGLSAPGDDHRFQPTASNRPSREGLRGPVFTTIDNVERSLWRRRSALVVLHSYDREFTCGRAYSHRGPTATSTLRLVFLLLGGLSLLAGLNAALLLLDLPAPLTGARLSEMHGELMVFGFLGTVISLERAVAARRWWAYLAPATLGLGALSCCRCCLSPWARP